MKLCKKTKLMALAVSVLLAAAVFAGCGSSAAEDSPGEDAASAGETVPDEDSAADSSGTPIELNLWYAGGKTAVDVLAGIVDEFNASQSEYHVSTAVQADYTETYQKLQAAISGSNAPDIALLDRTPATDLASKGLLEDLKPLMEADTDFNQSDYMEVFFEPGVLADGTIFAIPAYGTTQVLYYNKAAFEKAGIDPASIGTWQDLEAAAKKMTVQENGETTFYGWEPMWGVGNLIDAALSNGASIFSEDGKTVTINSPEWVEVWSSFGKWIHEDKIMRIHHGGQGWEYWYKTIDDVLQNIAGGYTGSSGDQADLDFSIVAALEQPGWGSNPSAPTADALQLVVPKRENPGQTAGAYEFMKFFTSPENQAKWSMATGYIAVNKNTQDVPDFKAYTDENPHALVPMQQAMHGSVLPIDPSGSAVYDALTIATDKVEIEGLSAQEALDEAQKEAQAALDEALGG
jgi:multiple sugar transport system substrate-binding protein